MVRHHALGLYLLLAASVIVVGLMAWDAGFHAEGTAAAGDVCTPPVVEPAAAGSALKTAGETESGSGGPLGFFTGGGSYMPRVHCMVNERGETDWPWVWALLVLNGLVVGGYAKIFMFWRRAYLAEQPEDRNKKLMDLAWIFLLCATCGYAASIAMFVWPAYRLLALMLVPLAFFTLKFGVRLQDIEVSLSAKRLKRELGEEIQTREQRLEREVADRTAELREARDAADRANKAKSAFIAMVSHEIRTPLTSLLGYADLLTEAGLDEPTRLRYKRVIERNGVHLQTVIGDVLDISKIESKRLELDSVECSPGAIVGDVVGLLGELAGEKGITITAETRGTIPSVVRTDPTRLRQVLLNLAGNAVKFTEQGSVRIVVSAEREGGSCLLTLEVIDTGIGMCEEHLDAVFEPFVQADAGTTRRFGGTGLGLAISRSLSELMGGGLEAVSSPGAGSVFTSWIRAEVPEAAVWTGQLEPEAEAPFPAEAASPALHGRVLLAEDAPDNRRLLTLLLKRFGLDVIEAVDGLDAVRTVEAERSAGRRIDLVLMDLDMPVCDGWEAMRRIKNLGHGVPIVAQTANTEADARGRVLSAGFDGFAPKPFLASQLKELCRYWIERRDAA